MICEFQSVPKYENQWSKFSEDGTIVLAVKLAENAGLHSDNLDTVNQTATIFKKLISDTGCDHLVHESELEKRGG